MKTTGLLLVASFSVAFAAPPQTQDRRQSLREPMTAELQRNHTEPKLSGPDPPSFLSYQQKDYQQQEAAARYGALFQDDPRHDRKIYVDVRVGSYEFDNSIGEDMDFNF